jgi:hypothetical protein
VLVNTKKGAKLWEMAKSRFDAIASTLDNAGYENYNLRAPTRRPIGRDTIYARIRDDEADIFAAPAFQISIWMKGKGFIRSRIPLPVRRMIRAVRKRGKHVRT